MSEIRLSSWYRDWVVWKAMQAFYEAFGIPSPPPPKEEDYVGD